MIKFLLFCIEIRDLENIFIDVLNAFYSKQHTGDGGHSLRNNDVGCYYVDIEFVYSDIRYGALTAEHGWMVAHWRQVLGGDGLFLLLFTFKERCYLS